MAERIVRPGDAPARLLRIGDQPVRIVRPPAVPVRILRTGESGPPGAQGLQGPAGPDGPQGNQGPVGNDGPTGPEGPAGPVGASGLAFRGPWDADVNYTLNDFVSHAGTAWFALAPSLGQEPADGSAYWELLALQGAPGPAGPQGTQGLPGPEGPLGPVGPTGVDGPAGPAGSDGPIGPQGVPGVQGAPGPVGPAGLTFRGAYSSLTTYSLDDLVTSNGSGYYSLVSGNIGHTPPTVSPFVDAWWALLVLQGAPGPAGVAGPTGAQGPQGNVGPQGPTGPAGPAGGGTLSSTLRSAVNASTTAFPVTASAEWVAGTLNMFALVDNELVLVTDVALVGGSNYTLTVTRAQRGTAAANHANGKLVYLRPALGSHVMPSATGVAAIGTSSEFARANHDHGIGTRVSITSAAATWTIATPSSFGGRVPSVAVYTAAGQLIIADVAVSGATVTVTHGAALAGFVILT